MGCCGYQPLADSKRLNFVPTPNCLIKPEAGAASGRLSACYNYVYTDDFTSPTIAANFWLVIGDPACLAPSFSQGHLPNTVRVPCLISVWASIL